MDKNNLIEMLIIVFFTAGTIFGVISIIFWDRLYSLTLAFRYAVLFYVASLATLVLWRITSH